MDGEGGEGVNRYKMGENWVHEEGEGGEFFRSRHEEMENKEKTDTL